MTSYHDTPVYADVEAEARADWLAERPDSYDPGDQEAGEVREFCSRCEHGHGGHVCRWCIARGIA